ncbi:50S ribosomal protein L21 [bacterium]|nr:50S ribosomal protein L21 [bacterium]
MYAVIETGGKQYKVREGDTIEIERLAGVPGEELTFDRVFLIGDGKDYAIGRPDVPGSKVIGELLRQDRGKKIVVGKFKRRKKYRRKTGHRQNISVVRIKQIVKPQKEQSDGS